MAALRSAVLPTSIPALFFLTVTFGSQPQLWIGILAFSCFKSLNRRPAD